MPSGYGRGVSAERRVVFLVNPGAGSGRVLARLHAALAPAPQLVARARTAVVRSLEEAGEVVQGLAPDEVPVAAGGDGTVNLLARALRAAGMADRPLATLPLGTGNAFGHPFGLGTVRGALRAIEAGTPRLIDVMTTTHSELPLALVSISAGFESRMLAAVERRPAWRRWLGLVPGLLCVATRSWTGIGVTVDGEPLVRRAEQVYNAGLYNLPCYGFGWLMWPEADATDGEAEAVACLSARAYWRTLHRGLRTAQPSADGDPRWRRWRRARFEADGPVQIDGEVVSGMEFEVAIESRGLSVLVMPGGILT
ncbi:MAG: hypothetical protein AUH78_20545 [Gemmatimonadetes bacterium 13_1_40CM_4_69_8]|nr:MAG: hypothetical protein AUH78_20545 [Gemmatimonadetes bacterium 13_1_40CM_4_69_8]